MKRKILCSFSSTDFFFFFFLKRFTNDEGGIRRTDMREIFSPTLRRIKRKPPPTARDPRSGGQTPGPEQRLEQCRYRRISRSLCDVLSCSSNSQHSRQPFESPWKPRVSESRALRFSAHCVSVARTWRGCASRRTCHRGVVYTLCVFGSDSRKFLQIGHYEGIFSEETKQKSSEQILFFFLFNSFWK